MRTARFGVILFSLHLLVMFSGSKNSLCENFHNGGTGNCQGCHTTPPELKGYDPGSTCLSCHQAPLGLAQPTGNYVASDAMGSIICAQLSPGGDFCWLKKSYSWTSGMTGARVDETSAGEGHGHNIIAMEFDYNADTKHVMAPGGSYRADNLSCISCHDPHGSYRRLSDGTIRRDGLPIIASGSYADSPSPDALGAVGVYRLLAGKGYMPGHLAGGFSFTVDPPAAVAPSAYNRAETNSDTRVAYGSGMSEWCANCHAGMINDNCPGAKRHVAGNSARLSQSIMTNYNTYISSGKLSGNIANSYTSMVPFEMATRDYAILKSTANSNGSNLRGPQGSANVMCLSCHRAHASGWDNMTRWNMNAEFIVYDGNYPGKDNSASAQYAQGRTMFEIQKTFYDRRSGSFADYQRSLCNKCHKKD
jgi:hypothetical protein